MKVKFEFDTNSDNFDPLEFEIYKQAKDMAMCLSDILDKLRGWYKYDNRESIPVDEIHETLIDKDITNESIYNVEVRIQNLNNMCGHSTQYKTYCRECFINNSVSEARDFRKEVEAKYGVRK